MNFYASLISFIFAMSVSSAHANNIKLEMTAENCEKIDGIGANDRFNIASKFKTPLKTIEFLGAKWGLGPYLSNTCIFLFDTGVGPKKCRSFQLLSDDGGKTAFAVIEPTMCQ